MATALARPTSENRRAINAPRRCLDDVQDGARPSRYAVQFLLSGPLAASRAQ